MTMLRVVCSCTALALSWPAAAVSQDEAATPSEVVSLKFAWEPGMSARVDALRMQVKTVNGVADTTIAAATYVMAVSDHPEGRLVSYSDFDLTDAGDTAPAGMPEAQALIDRIGAVMPNLVVSVDGDLLDVTGLEHLQREIRRAMQPLLGGEETVRPEVQALMDQAMSAEFLRAKAAEEWNALVGNWAGRDWKIGVVYELETQEPSPLLPDRLIPMVVEFAIEEWVPCAPGETESRCVLLTMVSRPDAEVVKDLIADVTSRMAEQGRAGGFVYESFDVETWIELVTEPASLRPHTIEIGQAIEVRGGSEGGPSQSQSQVRARLLEFSYSPD